MPELPDLTVYLDALAPRVLHQPLDKLRIANPFLLRTVSPSPQEVAGAVVAGLGLLGKRVVLWLDGGYAIVIHLMLAGRLHWKEPAAPIPKRGGLAALDFPTGTLLLTEAGSKRRASLHLVADAEALAALDPGGLDVLTCDRAAFATALRGSGHTVKRALMDPRVVSGIGNAYSDEILHAARLSPFKRTAQLDEAELADLFAATRDTLRTWIERLRAEAGGSFPQRVTAFRPDMAVHGRYGKPCPTCGNPVQRVVLTDGGFNYCAQCQTGGRVLADRALSRLLRDDWPRTLADIEALGRRGEQP